MVELTREAWRNAVHGLVAVAARVVTSNPDKQPDHGTEKTISVATGFVHLASLYSVSCSEVVTGSDCATAEKR